MRHQKGSPKINQDYIYTLLERPETPPHSPHLIATYLQKHHTNDKARSMEHILKARGFLIQQSPKGLQLNYHTHPNDYHYLKQLLNDTQLGTLNGTITIQKNPEPTDPRLQSYFQADTHSSYTTNHQDQTIHLDYNYFETSTQGIQVPTQQLDAYIAPLVKAINTLGITTWYSCDGHNQKCPYIAFASKYDAALFSAYYDLYIENTIPIHGDWRITYYSGAFHPTMQCCFLSINPTKAPHITDVYYSIYQAADILNNKRAQLQTDKQTIIDSLNPKTIQQKNIQQLNNTFTKILKKHHAAQHKEQRILEAYWLSEKTEMSHFL